MVRLFRDAPMRKRNNFPPLLCVLCLFISILFFLGCERGGWQEPGTSGRGGAGDVPPPSSDLLKSLENAFIAVSEKAIPSVVNISTTPKIKKQGAKKKPYYHNFLEELFPESPHGGETSLGSGLIISPKGYIISNEHVIKDAGEISVRLYDKREYSAKVVGVDPKTDIAVLKISADKNISPAKLGNSSTLKVGSWAVAVGNPFGLNSTVTVGVISAIGRTDIGVEAYEDFIQTDASINPGNSGGPLLNLSGEVIGIATAIISAGQGIGFAIPINLVKNISEQIIRTGTVRRGFIGVGIQNLTGPLAESFNIQGKEGVLVNNVFEDSPAMKGGIVRGDIILTFDGKPVESVGKFQRQVATSSVGKSAGIGILRGGKSLHITLIIGEMPSEGETFSLKEGNPDPFGLVVDNISPRDKKRMGIHGGVRVVSVAPGSPASEGGVRKGDLILHIGGKDIHDRSHYDRVITLLKTEVVSFLVKRKGRNVYLALKIR